LFSEINDTIKEIWRILHVANTDGSIGTSHELTVNFISFIVLFHGIFLPPDETLR